MGLGVAVGSAVALTARRVVALDASGWGRGALACNWRRRRPQPHCRPYGHRLRCNAAAAVADAGEVPNLDVNDGLSCSSRCEQLERVAVRNLSYSEMESWMASIDERPQRARQLWSWLYQDGKWAADARDLIGVNARFREKLSNLASFQQLELDKVWTARDGTRKMTFRTSSGGLVESVLIPAESGRRTLCVSSQVGCALNCQFCFTGRMGFKQHLSAAQIVEQLVVARRLYSHEGPITNVVFMGMGEPLHNLTNVLKAVDIMVDLHGLHLSHNKVTVSTSGLVPEIRTFCQQSKANLAVSLNATTDEIRSWIMPINRKYNLASLMQVLREEFPRSSGQREVLFEYVMLAGVNDSEEDAARALELTRGVPCKFNLIVFNPHSGTEFAPSPYDRVLRFRDILADNGLVTTIRHSKGDDQMAACGQLGQLGSGASTPPPRMKPPKSMRDATALC
eukprot:jgi/Chlat1/8151/Chrsp76S09201